MASPATAPYHRKPVIGPYHVIRGRRPDSYVDAAGNAYVDLRPVALPPYGELNTVQEATRRFDARTAEFVRATAGDPASNVVDPKTKVNPLLDLKSYNIGDRNHPNDRCLAALAYLEYFPYDRSAEALALPRLCSEAILGALPGYCGSINSQTEGSSDVGLGFLTGTVADAIDAFFGGENDGYDQTQMSLLQIAYRYYDKLSEQAQEWLVTTLLASGAIHRVGVSDDIYTSGRVPNDWGLAGSVRIGIESSIPIRETENHILQIHTARYLTNQLLYQRDRSADHDNRRNGAADTPGVTCMNLMLDLLRNFLKDDFSEYNAKPYQDLTRNALRNLCSYAYDHEVRLAARMVLDYLSAHMAVSSCDLRRLIPFRRRNEDPNAQLVDGNFVGVSLLDGKIGADRAAEAFAVQAGNTRGYETAPIHAPNWDPGNKPRPGPWTVLLYDDGLLEGLGDYRIPPAIHDLFITDRSRRFYQRLHRTDAGDVRTAQNADNMEIYAGSPSYLITAGGSPAGVALNTSIAGTFKPELDRNQMGVAMTTSFMPTGQSAGPDAQHYATDLIQFGSCTYAADGGAVGNYGVAPDFACGHIVRLPDWYTAGIDHSQDRSNEHGTFSFVDKHSKKAVPNSDGTFSFVDGLVEDGPGFFAAIYQSAESGFALLEAYDCWLHPELDFATFCADVARNNANLRLQNHVDTEYVKVDGSQIKFVIWRDYAIFGIAYQSFGANILDVTYGNDDRDVDDRLGDASRASGFLNGSIMNSAGDGLIVIANPALERATQRPQTITLDMREFQHPKRTSESGEIEEAGSKNEVWVDFTVPDVVAPAIEEGDFYRPFKTIAAAVAAVADPGVIKIMPGRTRERPHIPRGKRIRFEAALGGVSIGI